MLSVSNNSGEELGHIAWCNPWRQYCFYPTFETQFNNTCLQTISSYLTKLNIEHKKDK